MRAMRSRARRPLFRTLGAPSPSASMLADPASAECGPPRPPAPPGPRGASDAGALRPPRGPSAGGRPWSAPAKRRLSSVAEAGGPSAASGDGSLYGGSLFSEHRGGHARRLTRLSLASVDYEADEGPGHVEGGRFVPAEEGAPPSGSAAACAWGIVAAICGFPSLSLPYAVAQLGWAGVGVVVGAGTTTALLVGETGGRRSRVSRPCPPRPHPPHPPHHIQATALVVTLIEHPKGTRHATYSALATAHLGPRVGRGVVLPLQALACVGACVSTLIIGGGAVKALAGLVFPRPPHLAAGIASFALLQAASAAVPSLDTSIAASALGASAFAVAALLSVALSAAAGASARAAGAPPDFTPAANAPGGRLVSILVGIGLVINNLAIGIVPELAAGAAPPVARTMHRAAGLAFGLIVPTFVVLAVVGYWAFGSGVDVVLLASLASAGAPRAALAACWTAVALNTWAVFAAYACPLYAAAWAGVGRRLAARWPGAAAKPAAAAGRAALIAACALAAAAVPFFGEMGAIFGGVMMVLDYVIPPAAFIASRRPRAPVAALAAAAAVAATALAAAIVGASMYSLAVSAAALRLFADV